LASDNKFPINEPHFGRWPRVEEIEREWIGAAPINSDEPATGALIKCRTTHLEEEFDPPDGRVG
jgi:hypothetical protein